MLQMTLLFRTFSLLALQDTQLCYKPEEASPKAVSYAVTNDIYVRTHTNEHKGSGAQLHSLWKPSGTVAEMVSEVWHLAHIVVQ